MHTIIHPEPARWDAFVSNHSRAHVLQLSAWGDLKSAFGWSATRVALQQDDSIVGGAQLLFRPLPLNLGKMAYLPMGPLALPHVDEQVLWEAIHKTAKEHGARFLKWEPGIFTADEAEPDFNALSFRPSPQTVQPPGTILIDLTADEDAILARMNQGTRRKIRQGDKKGVRFYEGTAADVADFSRIINTTGSRNEFGVHDSAYYQKAFELFDPTNNVRLFMAEHEGDILAGIMVFAVGSGAWYLYGASSDVKRNLMATYGVQWQAIQWAKSRGCAYYDLWGIPDEDEATLEDQFKERSDGLWGVYGFKRGFGGMVTRSVGTWDTVYNSLIYTAYQTALKVRG